jgi:hypothetical protein
MTETLNLAPALELLPVGAAAALAAIGTIVAALLAAVLVTWRRAACGNADRTPRAGRVFRGMQR